MTSPNSPRGVDPDPILDPGPDTRPEDEVFDQEQPPAPLPGDDLATDHALPPAQEDDFVLGASSGGQFEDARPASGQSGRGEQAKQEVGKVAQDAKQGGQQVAQTAKEEAGQVASTVGEQARGLLAQTRSELSSQAGVQQQKLAESARTLGEDLQSLADGSPQEGMALDLTRQAAERTQRIASWLEGREPADLLSEVQQFARRRPGTFIAIAAGVGLLAGRFTRGLTQDSSSSSTPVPGQTGYGAGATQCVTDSQDVTGGHGLAGGTSDAGQTWADTPAPTTGYAPPAASVPGSDPYDETIVTDDVPRQDPFLPGDTSGPERR